MAENSYAFQLGSAGIQSTGLNKLIPSGSLVYGSQNINLKEGHCKVRGGTSIVERNHFEEIVAFTSYLGKFFTISKSGVFKFDRVTLYHGKPISSHPKFIVWNNNLLIFIKSQWPQYWDGISNTTFDIPEEALPIDFIDNFPENIIMRGFENSERLWVLGENHTSKKLYFSTKNDGISSYPSFKHGSNDTGFLYIETGDNEGLTSFIDFGDKLMIFSNTKTFILQDSATDLKQWGYNQSQFYGGCASQDLLCKTENDIVCMMKNGEIYSIRTVQQYGDYFLSSLTQKSEFNKYIEKFIELRHIDQFHMIFDRNLRAIKIFCRLKQYGQNNIALVFFLDKEVGYEWIIHNNLDSRSGYNAACSCNQLNGIFTADYSGNIWQLETQGIHDSGSLIPVCLKTPRLTLDAPRNKKRFRSAYIDIISGGAMRNKIKFKIDGLTQKEIDLFTPTHEYALWDQSYYDNAQFCTLKYDTIRYFINLIGIDLQQEIYFNVYNDETDCFFDKDFFNAAEFGGNFSKEEFAISTNMIDNNIFQTGTKINRISYEQ